MPFGKTCNWLLPSKMLPSRSGTAADPITKHQSLKVVYSNGTFIRFGRQLSECVRCLVLVLDRATSMGLQVARR